MVDVRVSDSRTEGYRVQAYVYDTQFANPRASHSHLCEDFRELTPAITRER